MAAATQLSSLMGGGQAVETCDSYVSMEAIAAAANAAELKTHAVNVHERMGIALRINHTELVTAGIQIASAAIGQVALGWFAAAKQHRFTLLGLGGRGFMHIAQNHLLNQSIVPQEDFLSAAIKAQIFL